eukprot:SAG31_NODE_150_length_22290_cov_5.975801_10_plen_120_part_00
MITVPNHAVFAVGANLFLDFTAAGAKDIPIDSAEVPRDSEAIETSDADEEEDDDSDAEEEVVYFEADHQSKMLNAAFVSMGIGSFLVLLFSDPMVDCLSDLVCSRGWTAPCRHFLNFMC